jgi:tetratricopeptide (TPR) repeat protein
LSRNWFLIFAGIGLITACSTAPAPPPAAAPQGEARYLIDPRVGWQAADPSIDRRFDAAWKLILASDYDNARKILGELPPTYIPATLAQAAIDLRQGRAEAARAIADRVASRNPNYIAAAVVQAEVDVAENQIQSAYERYRTIAGRPDAPPTVSQRMAELQTRLFAQLYNAALTASDVEAIQLLRQALLVDPAASAARVLLVKKLIGQRNFDEARRELDPLLSSSAADRPDVQEAIAEIDVGTGQYQDAIARYERLARSDPGSRYARRLEEVKEQFAAANMPPQFLRALEAESITRGDLAVLMYWKISSVRFAQDLAAPPIATDIGDVPSRDEIIRLIALGIYQVDPVTRQVNPYAPVNASSLARAAARTLAVRGASCARTAPSDAEAILAACRVSDPVPTGADVLVSGRMASAMMEQVDRALTR